jgi:hypothetical protein
MSEPEPNAAPSEHPPRVIFVASEHREFAAEHAESLSPSYLSFPEHGLHPNRVLFAVVADIVERLSDADPARRPLAILTHSEALLTLVGDLVAGNRIDPKDIAVDLVRRDGKPLRCRYSPGGYLRWPWPTNFFAPTTDAVRVWDAEVVRRASIPRSFEDGAIVRVRKPKSPYDGEIGVVDHRFADKFFVDLEVRSPTRVSFGRDDLVHASKDELLTAREQREGEISCEADEHAVPSSDA